MSDVDHHLEFFFDPVCPFAWQTSRWVRQVQGLRHLDVRWRFICLRIINDGRYDEGFPPHYQAAHENGRALLRVCAAVRDVYGDEPIGRLYEAFGDALWMRPRPAGDPSFDATMRSLAESVDVAGILASLNLPTALAGEVDNAEWDQVLRAEGEEALSRTGPDVGTPILTFDPPDGNSFFGPVISTLPRDDEALDLFEAVQTLARFTSFSELKRSKRPDLDLPLLRTD